MLLINGVFLINSVLLINGVLLIHGVLLIKCVLLIDCVFLINHLCREVQELRKVPLRPHRPAAQAVRPRLRPARL